MNVCMIILKGQKTILKYGAFENLKLYKIISHHTLGIICDESQLFCFFKYFQNDQTPIYVNKFIEIA